MYVRIFLRELKEQGTLKVQWIPGNENDVDLFTKKLEGPKYERFAQTYVGKDEYSPATK